MRKFTSILFILFLIAAFYGVSCSTTNSKKMKNDTPLIASPPVIVYKTRENYFDKVPVTLSDDRQKIVSYPAQSDVMREGIFVFPTELNDGYLLDNRGISPNTAFLRFSYEDYYNMDNIPNAERLMNYILDEKPFTEFYEVGRRGDFNDLVKEINQLISNYELKNIKNLAQ